jgi:hypothetical protein
LKQTAVSDVTLLRRTLVLFARLATGLKILLTISASQILQK